MRTLFLSSSFRSEKAYYARVKCPAELIVGVMRLVGDFRYPEFGLNKLALASKFMGQELMNPPTVEGWHTGEEWIDTGMLMERVNFAVAHVGDIDKPGVRKVIERLRARGDLAPEQFVDSCLDLVGPMRLLPTSREALIEFVANGGPLRLAGGDREQERRVGSLLQLIVATREYQLA
jgi:hypothetical protein